MLIIGEKLNSTILSVRSLIKEKNTSAVQDFALKQVESGADYLDLNTAQCDEITDMEWLIRTVQEVTDVPLCIDSTEPTAIKKGFDAVQGDKSRVMLNSISLEKNRLEGMLPIVLQFNCPVIGLTVDDNGIPKTAEDRIRIAERMMEILDKHNYDLNKLYIDPLVLPLAVKDNNAAIFFQCLKDLKEHLNVKTVSGLSNISFELPKRKIINRYFLAICMACDMDAAILDPLDAKIMTAVITTNLLLGKDRYTRKYLKAYRDKILVD